MAKRKNLNFEAMIQDGENPKGFTAQTANGTAHYKGTGWNRSRPWEQEQISEDGPWQGGTANRTGE